MQQPEEQIIPQKQGKSYEVGYKKPPKEHQFKPGQSGNPGGRPEGMSLTKAIRDRLKTLSPDGKRTALDFLADNIIQDALENNNKMRTLIWNYLDGMPKQGIEMKHDVSDNLFELINNAVNKGDGDTIQEEDKE